MKTPSKDTPRQGNEVPLPRLSAISEARLSEDPGQSAEKWAEALLGDAVESGVSDIHLDPRRADMVVRFRMDGVLHDVHQLGTEAGQRLVRYFKANSELDSVSFSKPEDAHFEFESDQGTVDVRVASAPCLNGEKMTLRLLPRFRIQLGLGELGLADDDLARVQVWLEEVTGMFLVSGPTGNGKTTTLHAILRELMNAGSSVVTIEDPPEYRVEGANQIAVDENADLTFANGLRTALRLDPDQILLGEIRDEESARTALRAAGTGHTILSSMHGGSAAGVITALRSFGLADGEIAPSLAFVISQRLVRKLCPDCKSESTPDEKDSEWLRRFGAEPPASVWNAKGCDRCRGSGYQGRTGIFELWPVNEEAYARVLNGEDESGLKHLIRDSGVRSLLEDGLEKVSEGITSLSELRSIGFLTPMQAGELADKQSGK